MDKERYEGFVSGFGMGNAELMLVPMHKEERWEFYGQNMERFQNVSAVFAVSDYYAIDLIHFFNEHGIRVPDDISVVGFDVSRY